MDLRFTSRDGGDPLKQAAVNDLLNALRTMEVQQGKTGLFRAFSARQEFPDAWQHFIFPPDAQAPPQTLEFLLGPDRFPSHLRAQRIKIDSLAVFVLLKSGMAYDETDPLTFEIFPPGGVASKTASLEVLETELAGLPAKVVTMDGGGVTISAANPWRLDLTQLSANLAVTITVEGNDVQRLDRNLVTDVGLLVHYTI